MGIPTAFRFFIDLPKLLSAIDHFENIEVGNGILKILEQLEKGFGYFHISLHHIFPQQDNACRLSIS